MLVVHAIAVMVLGFPLWLLFLALSAIAGADVTAGTVVFAVLVGPTPLLNALAAVNLIRRPRRAGMYLNLVGILAWLQVVAGALVALALTAAGGWFLLIFVALLLWLVIAGTQKALRLDRYFDTPPRRGGGLLRANAIDLAVAVGVVVAVGAALMLIWLLVLFPGA
ncbi:hypothetical protein [Glycomyces arizonensis]|uniref:hypothetical protein n=1 Tax=Glycomyces arizonensis TaxID=256035 RepID=UPI00047BA2C9|nr:hypothetical protein [Glycomyces arizonensis]